MSDGENNPWAWTPDQYPDMPTRVRDNEEQLRTHDDRIDEQREDMDSVKTLLTRCLVGITVIAVEGALALLFQYLSDGV